MKSEKSKENNVNYTLSCVYKNGKLYRSGLGANGTMSEIIDWNGQLVTSLMNTLDLKDYIQKIEQLPLKELASPLVKLCELLGLDINKLKKQEVSDYIVKIHNFAIWLHDLIVAKDHALDWFRIDLSDVTMEYSSSKEYEDCTIVIYNSTNIFLLAQIEFAECYKLGTPYIVCHKCNSIYFTHKVKSTKTCPFCACPSLDKNKRSIDKQAERLYNANPAEFEIKFINYLISKKGYSGEHAYKEYHAQLKKRKINREVD